MKSISKRMNCKMCTKKYQKSLEIGQNSAVQRNSDLTPCRARKMLKNALTLAIGGADTAENGPSKVRQVSNKSRRSLGRRASSCSRRRALACSAWSSASSSARRRRRSSAGPAAARAAEALPAAEWLCTASGRRLRSELNKLNKSPQALRRSFSAVWTATTATKKSFCNILNFCKISECGAVQRSAHLVELKKC